jgi:hypothetical protein
MQQSTFAEVTFEHDRKPTRREQFLDEKNRVVPWAEWVVSEPISPKATGQGVRRWASSGGCAGMVYTSGSTCRTRRERRPCLTPAPCGSVWAWLGAANWYRMRRRSVRFDICGKSTD